MGDYHSNTEIEWEAHHEANSNQSIAIEWNGNEAKDCYWFHQRLSFVAAHNFRKASETLGNYEEVAIKAGRFYFGLALSSTAKL